MPIAVATWGVLGVALLLCRALYQLTPFALDAVASGALGPLHWLILITWVAFSAYAEGYVGFHQKFSPKVVERAIELGRKASPLRAVLAAPYCMGLFDAPRKTMIRSWVLVVAIAFVVVGVRHVPQPWRGIIDAGVVVGLGIGVLSLLARFFSSLASILKTGFIFR